MIGKQNPLPSDIPFSGVFTMISIEEWNARIDAFIMEENNKKGRCVPVHRIYCQDDTDRSGGGIYNETVTVDTIGRFARALGDSNPRFSEPRYQEERTRQNRPGSCPGISLQPLQAPPLLECCICSTFIGGKLPRLRGISVFDAGSKWERFLPIHAGDSFSAQTESLGVREITKAASAGRLLLREHRIDLTNQRGELVSSLTARSAIKCAPPAKSALSAEKKAEYTAAADTAAVLSSRRETPQEGRPHYTDEELERVYDNLDAQLSGAFRRGAQPRFWEQVEIGEKVPEQIVGPYDESDGQALMAAIGVSNAFATKWAAIRFRKGQGVTDPETGARRHPIDRHSSDTIARVQGLPRAIVSGIHSQALLAKSVSDWMGDKGFLRSLDCHCRRPLYYGDLSLQRGCVTDKFEKDGRFFVRLEMEAVRQDGVLHTSALAIVELPSRGRS